MTRYDQIECVVRNRSGLSCKTARVRHMICQPADLVTIIIADQKWFRNRRERFRVIMGHFLYDSKLAGATARTDGAATSNAEDVRSAADPGRNAGDKPVHIQIDGNLIRIDCLVRYNKRALSTGPRAGLSDTSSATYADLIEAGIVQAWSGVYPISLPGHSGPIEVIVRLHRAGQPCFIPKSGGRQRSVLIRVRPMLLMPAHVISPMYRRIWGILRTGQLESLGLNWSPRHPGSIILPVYDQPSLVKSVAAHEAGHIFGIGDAYAAIYRFYSEAPGTRAYMMNSNQAVQAEEILMLLRAQQAGRMQFFPRRWHTRTFLLGLKHEIIFQFKAISEKIRQIRQRKKD